MTLQTPAKIYKAQQRGLTENNRQRLYATLNFENYQDNSRLPFGLLSVLNDETLGPNQEIKRQAETDAITILLPLVGALQYSHSAEADETIVPGEIAIIQASAVRLINPYEDGLINYLYITLNNTALLQKTPVSAVNLTIRNTLHEFINLQGIYGYMALFNGREDAVYKLKDPGNGLFIFVINGAFEVEGRLLEERDGLALWDAAEAEIEALSENAIILLLEMPLTGFTA